MTMNKWLWYGLVIVAVVLLIKSVIEENFILAIISLAMALLLKTQYHKIPLPNAIQKHKIYSMANQKIYENANSEDE